MTWQIESFTDVGGNKDQEFVKFIDLPSRTRAALRARDQRPAAAARGARLVDGATRWRSRARPRDYRDFIQSLEGGVRRRQAHLRRRRARGWFSDRTECYLAAGPPGARAGHRLDARTCRPAKACWRSRRRTRRSPAIDRINADYARHARRAARDRARALRRRLACCRRLLENTRMRPLRIAHDRAGRDDDPAAEIRIGRD